MDVMPGYKQTEVGLIPEDWVVRQIGGLKPFVTSGSRGWAAFYSDRGAPFIRISNLSRDSIYLQLEDLRLVNLPKEANEGIRTQLQDHDVLISITADIGIIGYVSSDLPKPAYVNQHIALVRLDSSNTNPKFVSYFLASEEPQKLFRALTDSGAKAGMSLMTVQKIHLALPPTKVEQEDIAEALSNADALIKSLERIITKKRELKQGAMQELLRPKDGWVEKTLGNTAVLKARIGWQGLTTAEYLNTGDYYLVTGTDFKGGYIDWSNCHFVDASRYKQDKNIQLRHHDVVVTKDGTIGKVALIRDLDRPATLNSGVFVIRPIEGAFHPSFFYYILCSNVFTKFLTQLSAGSTINHLYQKDFVNFKYKTPSTTSKQVEIAAILSDMDTEIAALEMKLLKYRQIKQGMMHNLLTGKIRLVAPALANVKAPVAVRSDSMATEIGSGSHTWAFNEAVIISVLADQFGKPEFPLGRKRRTKLSYLFHRKTDQDVQGYLKKAAGPYNPRAKYAGPEKIAQENGYVRNHQSGKFNGFIAAEKIAQAKTYFSKWYDPEITAWLEQFRFRSNDELECLATVDMAMQELMKQNKTADVDSVRALIASEPDWLPKLDRSTFSDSGVGEAIAQCHALFK